MEPVQPVEARTGFGLVTTVARLKFSVGSVMTGNLSLKISGIRGYIHHSRKVKIHSLKKK